MKSAVCLSMTIMYSIAALGADLQSNASKYLSSSGLPSETQMQMPPGRIEQIYDGITNGKYGTNVVFSTNAWQYPMQVAEANPDYSDPKLLKRLKERIGPGVHAHRKGNQSENLNRLNPVDKHMLSLLSMYVDVFDRTDDWFLMSQWFPNGIGTPEKGGMVFGNDGLEVVLMDTEWQKAYYPDIKLIQTSKVYLHPFHARYIERIGTIHTHPKFLDEVDYTGPAGDLDCGPLGLDDTSALVKDSMTNPLQMDAVISWIKPDEINVDVYFRNIILKKAVPVNKGKVIVVDLGNFKVRN